MLRGAFSEVRRRFGVMMETVIKKGLRRRKARQSFVEISTLGLINNSYFTRITRYLLVLQNICGFVMRSVYCLLAS